MSPAPRGPDPARGLVLDLLRRVNRGAFLAPTLRHALDASSLEGAARSFVTSVSYGTLRHLERLDAALAARLERPDDLPDAVRWALRAAAFELLVRGSAPHGAVDAWVEIVKGEAPGLAGLANAVLRRLQPPTGDTPEARLALPAWLHQAFVGALGGPAAERAALGMLEDGPLWLTALSDAAEASLRSDGCEVEAGPLPGTLRVRAPLPLDRLGAFRAGMVQPQNPAATLPVRLLGDVNGRDVLDLAAGSGVKTAQLAAAGARVTALEIDEGKARAAAANLRRLGLEARHVVADLTATSAPTEVPPAAAVLLDAPCSGTGTLRGHPEIKLRLRAADVGRLAALQAAMLDAAAELTAPGGTLVYAVCSLTEAEGAGQVRALLGRRRDVTAESFELGVPSVEAPGAGRYVLSVGGLDGFFVARLRREGGAAAR